MERLFVQEPFYFLLFFQFPTIGQQKKRRSYDTALISQAFKDVREKGTSVYRAAREYGVPESTLRDRHLGIQPVDNLPNHGPAPLFSHEEEKSLVDHIEYMCNIGYGYSRQAFLDTAFDYAVILNKKSPGDPTFKQSWYQGFIKRWPQIRLAKPEKLAIIRAKATSKEVLDAYFSDLETVIKANNLDNAPERIWNVDESGILMEHTPPKVLCTTGAMPQSVTSPRGKNVTIIGSGNAAGNHIPPYFIFPGKRWNEELLKGTSPGTNGEMSESGWSNSTTFLNYLQNHFLKFIPRSEGNKHLIIFDGHRSHVSLTLTSWGKEHGIEFFILPPHTSHLTQPLDVGCFAPLKAIYNVECQTYMRLNPGHQITRYVVGELACKAYLKALSPDNIISAFRRTGIFPFKREKISDVKVLPATIYPKPDISPDSQQSSSKCGEQFLESRKITAVKESIIKKRKAPPTIVGTLSSSKNQGILQASSSKKLLNMKEPIPSTSSSKKENDHDPLQTSDFSEDEMEITANESLCCVCKRRMPESMKSAYVIEFVQWAQCDKCSHWTHLKYCSEVRCLRRGSDFLCPHCEKQ